MQSGTVAMATVGQVRQRSPVRDSSWYIMPSCSVHMLAKSADGSSTETPATPDTPATPAVDAAPTLVGGLATVATASAGVSREWPAAMRRAEDDRSCRARVRGCYYSRTAALNQFIRACIFCMRLS